MSVRGASGPGAARGALIGACAVLAACDLLITDPAPPAPEIGISFQVVETPLGGRAAAFSRVRRVALTFVRPDDTTRDTVVAVMPIDGVIRTTIQVPAPEREGQLAVQADLGYDATTLFRGGTTVEVVAGAPVSTEIQIASVPAAVSASPSQLSLLGPGATGQLAGAVLFASGDTIDGLGVTWSSADPAVAVVGANGLVVAQAEGTTTLEARLGPYADTVDVEVVPFAPTGATNEWNSSSDGSWSDGASWSQGRPPAAGDSVRVTGDGTYTVDSEGPVPPLAALEIGGGTGRQSVSFQTAGLSVAGDVTVAGTGALSLADVVLTATGVSIGSGGSLRVLAGAHVDAPVANAGDIAADSVGGFLDGTLTNAPTASIRVGGGTFASSLTVANGFTNQGLVRISGSSQLVVTSGTLVNEAGASLDVVTGPIFGTRRLAAPLDNRGTVSIGADFDLDAAGAGHVNSGSMDATGATFVRVLGADAFDNTGVFDAGTASVDFTFTGTGAGFSTSGSVSAGAGQLSIHDGPFAMTAGSIAGAGTLRLYDLGATMSAAVTLGTDLPTFVELYASTLTVPSVTVAASSVMILAGSTLSGALVNQGRLAVLAPGTSTITGPVSSAAAATVSVEGTVNGDAEAVFAAGLTTAGFVNLTSSAPAAATLTVTGGALQVLAGGTVNAGPGNGARTLTAQIDNQGSISSNTPFVIDATGTTLTNGGTMYTNTADPFDIVGADAIVNDGMVSAGPGTLSIQLSGTGPGVTNNGSLVALAGGTLAVSNGAVSLQSGGFGGAGHVQLTDVDVTDASAIPLTLGTTGPDSFGMVRSTYTGTGMVVDTTTSMTVEGATIAGRFEVYGVLDVGVGTTALTGAMLLGQTGTVRVAGAASAPSVFTVPNGFTNDGVIELTSAGSGDATLSIGNGALTNGNTGTILSGTTAGAGGVRSVGANVTQLGAISLQAPLTLGGQLVDPAGVPSSYSGNGSPLTVAGLDVSGAVFDAVPLVSIGGALTQLGNSSFVNMDPTWTQLTIEHPGTAAGPVSFTSLTFATAPTTGLYVSLTDSDPLALPLTLEILSSSPASGSAQSQTFGGATLIW